ncbi:hypothetical protein FGB62_4g469 [Gracilaria domingensis]|nr:hypothetical protein FGB62_4g469 [Gracilaria domingensis]
MNQTIPPPIVQYLGYGGTIPFVTGALASTITSDPTFFARATQLYGSSILSFLGAVHWGVALRSGDVTSSARNVDFVYGVTPSLVGWTAALMQPADGLALLTTSFCAAYAYDYVRFRVPGSTPPWYLRLRGPLSIAAIGGCGVSYLAMRRKLAAHQSPQPVAHDAPPAEEAMPEQSAEQVDVKAELKKDLDD